MRQCFAAGQSRRTAYLQRFRNGLAVAFKRAVTVSVFTQLGAALFEAITMPAGDQQGERAEGPGFLELIERECSAIEDGSLGVVEERAIAEGEPPPRKKGSIVEAATPREPKSAGPIFPPDYFFPIASAVPIETAQRETEVVSFPQPEPFRESPTIQPRVEVELEPSHPATALVPEQRIPVGGVFVFESSPHAETIPAVRPAPVSESESGQRIEVEARPAPADPSAPPTPNQPPNSLSGPETNTACAEATLEQPAAFGASPQAMSAQSSGGSGRASDQRPTIHARGWESDVGRATAQSDVREEQSAREMPPQADTKEPTAARRAEARAAVRLEKASPEPSMYVARDAPVETAARPPEAPRIASAMPPSPVQPADTPAREVPAATSAPSVRIEIPLEDGRAVRAQIVATPVALHVKMQTPDTALHAEIGRHAPELRSRLEEIQREPAAQGAWEPPPAENVQAVESARLDGSFSRDSERETGSPFSLDRQEEREGRRRQRRESQQQEDEGNP